MSERAPKKAATAPAPGLIYRCARGPEGAPAAELRETNRLIRLRAAPGTVPLIIGECGADLTPLITKMPADGKDHVGHCPTCGGEFHFMRTPPDAPVNAKAKRPKTR